ncbi:MAG: hypothetical protein ACOX1Q_00120 [Eubacteriales bacterium]
MPFSHILRNYKLDTAAKLLEQTEQNLNSICDAIGYKDSTQFIRSFKNALARPLPNTEYGYQSPFNMYVRLLFYQLIAYQVVCVSDKSVEPWAPDCKCGGLVNQRKFHTNIVTRSDF